MLLNDEISDLSARAREVLSLMRESGVERVEGLLDEGILLELPFAPPGMPNRIEGRTAVMAFFKGIATIFSAFRIIAGDIYDCRPRNAVIIEATGIGEFRNSQRVYQNRYVFVFVFNNGLVSAWKEFFNPYALTESGSESGN
jgi:uncharacterized protein